MAITFKWRRNTAANATTNNPTLGAGEPGWETDTNKWKIGDGITAWTSLAYQPFRGTTTPAAVGTAAAGSSQEVSHADHVHAVVSPTATGSTGARLITISTSDPSGGADGDVWVKYTA